VARGDLPKAKLTRERGDAALVLGIAVGVHEHDRGGVEAIGARALEIAAHGGEVGLGFHGAVGAHALVDFERALVEHLGLDDVAGEDLRPSLVADAQRVAEAFRDDEERALALALEERIGGNRCAHLHGADRARRDRLAALEAEQVADARHGGVAIGFRVLGEELVRDQRSIWPPPDNVGEGAAAVDPEFPRSFQRLCGSLCHCARRTRCRHGLLRRGKGR
jgi:hypothetical protein